MPLLATCQELFGTSDLYEVLGVERAASQGQVKKAYHKVGWGSLYDINWNKFATSEHFWPFKMILPVPI